MHPHLFQLGLGRARRFLVHRLEQAVAGIDEIDVHLVGKVGIVARHNVALHLGQGAGYLNARRTTAHNHHVHILLPPCHVLFGLGTLQGLKDVVAQSHAVDNSLHGESMLLGILVAKEIGSAAHRQHKVIIVYWAHRCDNSLLAGVDSLHLGHAEVEMLVSLKNAPYGKRNVARLKACRSHLIDEWRKLVVVVLVDDHHLVARVAQAASQPKPAKTASHNDDSLQTILLDVCFHSLLLPLLELFTHCMTKNVPVAHFNPPLTQSTLPCLAHTPDVTIL